MPQCPHACFVMAITCAALAPTPWPAEPYNVAINLTGIEGPGVNDFHFDLSGAVWNPVTRRLWVCRNGPGAANSKLWAIRENGAGGYEIDVRNNRRGEWTGFGDLEAVTLVNYDDDLVYLLIEGEDRIRELNVSTYGVNAIQKTWNFGQFVPAYELGNGSEGLAFVPDSFLASSGFVDPGGRPRTSQGGMGGLMFVAHQQGGRLYAFDLNRNTSSLTFVGAYKTSDSESADLCFDRATCLMFVLHSNDANTLELIRLSSTAGVLQQPRMDTVAWFSPPPGTPPLANMEGLAVVSDNDCVGGRRSLFITIDTNGPESLLRFRDFPCPCTSSADCFDADACNGREFCDAGVCSRAAFSCDDRDACTEDACDPITGCTHTRSNSIDCNEYSGSVLSAYDQSCGLGAGLATLTIGAALVSSNSVRMLRRPMQRH